MLISHRKQFIYTKTAKTAGTSVESYFEKYCMPEGEWTPLHDRESHVSTAGIIGWRGSNRPKSEPWFHHMPAKMIKAQIGDEIWNRYFKFCVVRNPFDKAVSAFFHFKKYREAAGEKPRYKSLMQRIIHRIRPAPQFASISAEFEYWLKTGNIRSDRDRYTIDERFCVDEVIRYEHLHSDLEKVCQRIGIAWEPDRLPEFKKGIRDKTVGLAELYTPRSIRIISKLFAYELERFGYQPPELRATAPAHERVNEPRANPLVNLLRKAKERVPGNHQRRIERETRRVTQVFAGELQPVLIHTYGKVGSTAIQTAIKPICGFGAFQTHFISEQGIAEARVTHQDHGRDPVHLQVGEALRQAMAAHPEKVVRVITLVREPVARAISNLFENPVLLLGEEGQDLSKLPLERLVAIATEQVRASLDYTERWFDRELSGLFGFDFFATPFDCDTGFTTHAVGRVRLLSGKLEKLSTNGGRFIGEFLGLPAAIDIPHRRTREATGEAKLYDQVRRSLKLPSAFLDEIYASRTCRHFYTPAEIGRFRTLWQA